VRETGIGASVLLILLGGLLAFAVRLEPGAIDVKAVGAILFVAGLTGLLLSSFLLGDIALFGPAASSRDASGPHSQAGNASSRAARTPRARY